MRAVAPDRSRGYRAQACRMRRLRQGRPPRLRSAVRVLPNTGRAYTLEVPERLERSFIHSQLFAGHIRLCRGLVVVLVDTTPEEFECEEVTEAHRHRHDVCNGITKIERNDGRGV